MVIGACGLVERDDDPPEAGVDRDRDEPRRGAAGGAGAALGEAGRGEARRATRRLRKEFDAFMATLALQSLD